MNSKNNGIALVAGTAVGIGKSAQLRLMRRYVPEKAFAKSFRKEMGLPL